MEENLEVWEEEWTADDEGEEQQERRARRLGFLPSARLRELEVSLHDVCDVKKCESCKLKESSGLLERETAAILRCGHVFCQQCISNDRETPRDARYCPKCTAKFRSMYVLNGQGKLVRWSIGGNREKNAGRNRGREEEGKKELKKGKDCVVQ
ncbi:hypothetical protein Vi05172_g9804 [Venturia inaequalis]|nr:hypothetical protein Vi05172_g9804 [Venturia inaequalis]